MKVIIAVEKEVFKKKKRLLKRKLKLGLTKTLKTCFVWSVALHRAKTRTLINEEAKRVEALKIKRGEG